MPSELEITLEPLLCFNWLPRYRSCLLTYKSLQQLCACRTVRTSTGVQFHPDGGTNPCPSLPVHLVRPVLLDSVYKDGDWCGYIRAYSENRLLPFPDGRPFYPLTEEIALVVAQEEGSNSFLNNVVPYMSPAPQTFAALLAVAGGYAGADEQGIASAHVRRKAAARQLRDELTHMYGLPNCQTLLLHSAGVGGLIEATSRYLHQIKPDFRTCVVVPEYWDMLRYILTYSPQGLTLVQGRDESDFPVDRWTTVLSSSNVDFAYISFTSNPLGTTLSWNALEAALQATPDDTLFFLDCTSFDTEERSTPQKLARLLTTYSHKNLVVAKSFAKEYDLGQLRLGYAIYTRPETAAAIRPLVAGYPAVANIEAARKGLKAGNLAIMRQYCDANALLKQRVAQIPTVRATGTCSNYTCIRFESEDDAISAVERLEAANGYKIYPGELPMRGGGNFGLDRSEVDLTTMKRIPFLDPCVLRLLVTPVSIAMFFDALEGKSITSA